MRNHHILILAAALFSITTATTRAQKPASAAPDAVKLAQCRRNLEVIGRALKAYRREHHGESPLKLINLVPRYLKNRSLLLCPAGGATGIPYPGGPPIIDPDTHYEYHKWWCNLPGDVLAPRDGDWEKLVRTYYGDTYTDVDCFQHGAPRPGGDWPLYGLILNRAGQVRWGFAAWELEPVAIHALLAQIRRELNGKPSQFTHRWTPEGMDRYAGGFHSWQYPMSRTLTPDVRADFALTAGRVASAARRWPADDRNNAREVAVWLYCMTRDNRNLPILLRLAGSDLDKAALFESYFRWNSIDGWKGTHLAGIGPLDRRLAAPGLHPRVAARLAQELFRAAQDARYGSRVEGTVEQMDRRAVAAYRPLGPSVGLASALVALAESTPANELRQRRALLDEALSTAERVAPRSRDLVTILVGMGITSFGQGDLTAARDYLMRSVSLGRSIGLPSHELEKPYFYLGLLARRQGNLQAASSFLEAAAASTRKNGTPSVPEQLWWLNPANALSDVKLELGDLKEARRIAEFVYTTHKKVAPDSASPILLAEISYREGDMATARAVADEVMALSPKRTDPDAAWLLARILDEIGDRAGAIARDREALDTPPIDGFSGRFRVTIMNHLARLLIENGQSEEARDLLQRVRALEDSIRSVGMDFGPIAKSAPSVIVPEVRFLAPADESTVHGSAMTLRIAFLAPIPLKSYRIWVNGRALGGPGRFDLPTPNPKGQILEKGQVLEKGLVLEKGEQRDALAKELPAEIAELVKKPEYSHYAQVRLNVPLEETDGEFIRIAVQVTTTGGSISDRSILRLQRPEARTNRGSLRVLSIGVGEYQNLPMLKYAAADSDDLGQAFRMQAGEGKLYDGPDVTILGDADATLSRIRQALDQLIANTRPGDTVIVAFSGHGLKKGDATFFAPVRCDPENIEGTGLPWREVLEKLEVARKTAKAVWVLADCCRAAPGLRKDVTAATSRDIKRGVEEGGNLIICTASSGDSPSYESEELKHGIFTAAWLEALSGKSPALVYQEVARGKVLTLSGLQFALDLAVSRMARTAGVRQIMEFPRLEGSFSPSQPVFVPASFNR